ncbi:hypothetical protein IG631_13309 [Alternaria alternata]|nr:hypothetical protein IG631_13309 [Alternaria alternata]
MLHDGVQDKKCPPRCAMWCPTTSGLLLRADVVDRFRAAAENPENASQRRLAPLPTPQFSCAERGKFLLVHLSCPNSPRE